MATAVTQLGLDHSSSQLLNSTHWDACCSSDELSSDASSDESSKQLLKPTWQSLYARCPGSTGSSSQAQAAIGCFALHQHQCQPLQLPNGITADATEEHQYQQQCLSTPPTTPGGLPAPAARYLQLSCEPLAGTPACPLTTEGPDTPCPAAAAGGPAEQAASGSSDSRRQLQQWLARRESSLMVKTADGSKRSSSDSSNESVAVEGLRLPGPAVEIARALPPPAFLILGVLG
jgi:hypothetical protein